MLSKYFSHIIVCFITVVICLILAFSFRHNVTTIDLGDEYGQCAIITNMITGKSCLIGGAYFCNIRSESTLYELERCD